MGEKGRDPLRPQFTDHCFTGDYPTPLTDLTGETKSQLSLLAEASRGMPLPLAGRVALVTGASRGIGYATALALARAGAHVVAVARTVGSRAGQQRTRGEIAAITLCASPRATLPIGPICRSFGRIRAGFRRP